MFSNFIFKFTISNIIPQTDNFSYRLANPIYLGAYLSGLISTIICFCFVIEAPYHFPTIINMCIVGLILFHCGLLFKTLKGISYNQ